MCRGQVFGTVEFMSIHKIPHCTAAPESGIYNLYLSTKYEKNLFSCIIFNPTTVESMSINDYGIYGIDPKEEEG